MECTRMGHLRPLVSQVAAVRPHWTPVSATSVTTTKPSASVESKANRRRQVNCKQTRNKSSTSLASVSLAVSLVFAVAVLAQCGLAGLSNPAATRNDKTQKPALDAATASLAVGKTTVQQQQQQQRSECAVERPDSHQDELNTEKLANVSSFSETDISRYVTPTFYTLRLKLDPTKRKFSAQLMITLEVDSPAAAAGGLHPNGSQRLPNYRYLTLNAGPDLSIKKAFYVFTSLGSNVQVSASKIIRPQARSDLATIDFYPNYIKPGQGLLLIVYTGLASETESAGLFQHRSAPGAAGLVGLATHMQPNYARHLFPCWDEPALKARFSLVLVLPFRGYTTISNTPIKRKSISLSCSGESLQEIEFQQTPVMSTYLLTIVVGRFDHLEATTQNNCKIRVYVYSNATLSSSSSPVALTPSSIDAASSSSKIATTTTTATTENYRKSAAEVPLQVAVRSFDEFESLLGVRFPLSKFDLIGLREFQGGGMENWGASIFHENYLLYSDSAPQFTSAHGLQVSGGRMRSRRFVVPLVVGHEIAHQWFGNLVTARTWNNLWLNEGFAQFLMFELVDKILPGQQFWMVFMEDVRQSALSEDELLSTSRPLESPEDPYYSTERKMAPRVAIDQSGSSAQPVVFDSLTYNKGANLVRMMALLMGRDNFFAGLNHYLIKHSYGSVRSSDLLLALEESWANQQRQWRLEELMPAWIEREGFPLITVHVYEHEPGSYRLAFKQSRFTLINVAQQQQQDDKTTTGSVGNQTAWWIPLAIACEQEPRPTMNQLASEWNHLRRPQLAHILPASNFTLDDQEAQLVLPKAQLGDWLKLNYKGIGHFRVHYYWPVLADGSTSAEDASTARGLVDMLGRLAAPIRSKQLDAVDRLNIIDDLFALVRAGKRPTSYYLRYISSAYGEESELTVLQNIVDHLEHIRSTLISNTRHAEGDDGLGSLSEKLPPQSNDYATLESKFERFVQAFMLQVYRAYTNANASSLEETTLVDNLWAELLEFSQLHLNQKQQFQFEGPTESDKGVELLVWTNLVSFGHKQALSKAADFLAANASPLGAWLDPLDRDFRASIYSAAILWAQQGDGNQVGRITRHQPASSNATQTTTTTMAMAANETTTSKTIFDTLLAAYPTGESAGNRFAIATALGRVSEPTGRAKLLELVVKNSYFRLPDLQHLLNSLAISKAGRLTIWETFEASWRPLEPPLEAIHKQPGEEVLAQKMLKSLALGLVDSPSGLYEKKLRQCYELLGPSWMVAIIEAAEQLRINTGWFKRDIAGLAEYLGSRERATDLVEASPSEYSLQLQLQPRSWRPPVATRRQVLGAGRPTTSSQQIE